MQTASARTFEEEKKALLDYYLDDQCAFCREILSSWFPKPMPWVHRGLLAILTRNTSFLLKFGEEQWAEGRCRWTKKGLSKIVRHFTYPINPKDPQSLRKPIFRVKYAEDGRTPKSIDIVVGRFSNFILPRGCSKTTLVNASVILSVLYKLVEYFVYISESQRPHAEDQLATVERELSDNERILALWGQLVPPKSARETNRSDQIEFLNGVIGAAKGRGSQIRGMNKFAIRPDLIIMDDIENDESILTEESRDKTKKWVYRTVEPALVRIRKSGRIINLGTIRHTDDISQTLARDKQYTTVTFGAIDPDGDMLWDHYMTKDRLERERERYASVGQLYEFGLEYMSRADLDSQAKFKPSYYQNYRYYEPPEFIRDYLIRCIAIDPAISDDPRACYCALAVIGLSPKGMYHVADLVMKIGMAPDEQVKAYFELAKRWQCTRFLVETISYQKALKHLLKEKMFEEQMWFEIESAEKIPGNDKSKHIRVEGILQPRMAAGVVSFNQRWPELEAQFADWGHAKKDGPDVISMALVGADPYAGLALSRGEAAADVVPAILREKTMPDLDMDHETAGVP